ncbi:hypothetical protein K8I31_22930, partial [bacterium]|nr:hypothetical protein [bacterium]
MMLRCLFAFFLAISLTSYAGEPEYDGFGGWTGLQGEATGFFHTEQIDGVWWIIDPVGNAFISKGVNHIVYNGDFSPKISGSPYKDAVSKKYDSAQEWSKVVAERLKTWGFNSIGA